MVLFEIGAEVFETLPTLCVGLVYAEGFDNGRPSEVADRALDEAIEGAEERLTGMKASEDPRVQPYRAAFHALGMSPSRYPSSNIALLRRVAKGKGVGRINALVDLGNAVSIAHGLPLGVHVMGSPTSLLELRMSRAGDVFVPLGAAEADPTLAPGELVYAEGDLVQTRRWTWRQSENGKTGPDATSALIPIDGFTDSNLDAVLAARDELAHLIEEAFGCRVATGLASADSPRVELAC
ncbi:MAG: hypothetical protein IKG18_17310 [Atopobiaceae bacterium]|nr:hypothetical protein [Atopobiaceae bacterium]